MGRFRWEGAGFDGWLFGIARRVTADHLRRGKRRAADRPINDRDSTAEAMPGDDLELAEEHARVRKAFLMLSDADRDLLELRIFAGLSGEQTAVALGKKPGAVRTAQSRAVARLRKLLGEEQ